MAFSTYQSTLARWLKRQKESRAQFGAAEEPLRKSVEMFQPGGGYGRGQETLLREEARRAGAEATTQQVATGMASGSLATGTGLRIKRDLATSLAGVQDVRTQFLGQALGALSGLRAGQAQITAATVDPTYAPYMGYEVARRGIETRAETARQGTAAQLGLGLMQTRMAMREAEATRRRAAEIARAKRTAKIHGPQPTPRFQIGPR